jgi:WD40 repeat protein
MNIPDRILARGYPVFITLLRSALLGLLVAVSALPARAETPDNLPVTLIPNTVELGWDTHATLAASGTRLIVTDSAGIYVWDVASKRLVRRIVHDVFAKSVALTPDESMIITGHMDGKIRLWSLATGAPAGVLQEKVVKSDTYEIPALAVSSSGGLLVSGSEDGTITVWNLKTYQKVRSFPFGLASNAGFRRVIALRLTANQKELIAVTRDSFRKFDLGTGRQMAAADLPTNKDSSYIFLDNGIVSDDGLMAQYTAKDCDIAELRYLDSKDIEKPVSIDKPANCKRREDDDSSLGDPSLFVNAARSTVLIARGGTPELKEWDLKTRAVTRTVKWPGDTKPELIGVDKDFARVITNTDDHVTIRELASGNMIATFDTTTYPADTVLSKDGKTILLAQQSGKTQQQVTLWDVGATEPKKVLRIAGDNETTIRDFSPDAKLAAAIAKDDFVLYSLDTGETVRRLKLSEIKSPSTIRLSPDGKLALLRGNGPDDNDVALLVDASDGSIRKDLNESKPAKKDDDNNDDLTFITDGSFSVDGKRLALGRFNGTAEIWDVVALKQVKQLPVGKNDPGQIWSLSFSADGKKLLSCSRDGGAYLWTIDQGKAPRAFLYDDFFAGHAHLGAAALSHDGAMVAAGSSQHAVSSGDTGRERSVKTWNAATGKLRKSWLGHESAVNVVTFSPNDRMIVSASRDGTIKYWDAETFREIATILVDNNGHWAVLSPSGLFSGNSADANLFGLSRGMNARPASDFKAQLEKPDLIAELLKGDPNRRYATAAKQIDLKRVWDAAAP